MFSLVVIIEIRRYLRINQVGQNIIFDILEVPLKVLSLPVYWDSKPGSQISFPASPDTCLLGTEGSNPPAFCKTIKASHFRYPR